MDEGSSMQVFIGVISCDRAEHTVSSHLPASRAGRLDDAPYSSEENINDATISNPAALPLHAVEAGSFMQCFNGSSSAISAVRLAVRSEAEEPTRPERVGGRLPVLYGTVLYCTCTATSRGL